MSFFRRIEIPKFGGMNRFDPPHLIDDFEAQDIRDARLERNRLEARLFKHEYAPPKAITTWDKPIRFFSQLKASGAVQDIVVTDGKMYRDYTLLESGFGTKDRWSAFIHNGIMYVASRDAMRVISTSAINKWGIVPPSAAPTTAEGAAGTLTGEYLYKYTFYNADGIESDSSPASTSLVVAADKQVDISAIAVSGDSQVTGRYIYRIGGLVGKYYRIKDLADNTTTTWSDNMADGTAATQSLLSVTPNDNPPGMPLVVLHNGRAFYAGNQDNPNRLYYSESLYPEYSGNYRTVGGHEALTSLAVWESELFLWKLGEIFSLQGSVPGTGLIRDLNVRRGTVAPSSVAVGKFPTYIHYDGIYTHDGYTDNPIGRKMYDLFKNDLNTDALPNSVGVANNQFYICAVPEKGYENPSILVIYNYETRDTHIQEIAATALYAAENGDVYVGTPDGKILLLKREMNLNDEDVKFRWLSKEFFIGPQLKEVGSLREVNIVADTKGEDVDVFCYLDGVRTHCGTINSTKKTTHEVGLPERDGLFAAIELKYTGQKRPVIYPPVVINPEGEVPQ